MHGPAVPPTRCLPVLESRKPNFISTLLQVGFQMRLGPSGLMHLPETYTEWSSIRHACRGGWRLGCCRGALAAPGFHSSGIRLPSAAEAVGGSRQHSQHRLLCFSVV